MNAGIRLMRGDEDKPPDPSNSPIPSWITRRNRLRPNTVDVSSLFAQDDTAPIGTTRIRCGPAVRHRGSDDQSPGTRHVARPPIRANRSS